VIKHEHNNAREETKVNDLKDISKGMTIGSLWFLITMSLIAIIPFLMLYFIAYILIPFLSLIGVQQK